MPAADSSSSARLPPRRPSRAGAAARFVIEIGLVDERLELFPGGRGPLADDRSAVAEDGVRRTGHAVVVPRSVRQDDLDTFGPPLP